MPVCGSKFVPRSSRKATVAETVVRWSRGRMPSLVGDLVRCCEC